MAPAPTEASIQVQLRVVGTAVVVDLSWPSLSAGATGVRVTLGRVDGSTGGAGPVTTTAKQVDLPAFATTTTFTGLQLGAEYTLVRATAPRPPHGPFLWMA